MFSGRWIWTSDFPARSSGATAFITGVPRQTDEDVKNKVIPAHWVVYLGAADGKERWRSLFRPANLPMAITHSHARYRRQISLRLVRLRCDGRPVDFDGQNRLAARTPGPVSVYPGVSSSPVLYSDSLLILCDQGKDSFLLALNKNTGEVKWKRNAPGMRQHQQQPGPDAGPGQAAVDGRRRPPLKELDPLAGTCCGGVTRMAAPGPP